LIVHDFGTGTRGFAAADEPGTAVCVRPGTEIAFEDPIRTRSPSYLAADCKREDAKVAIFRQINKEREREHHDALELPDGEVVLLTLLYEGQKAKVLQLPAEPKTAQEAKDQERIAWAG
jgi:hypothetical protein